MSDPRPCLYDVNALVALCFDASMHTWLAPADRGHVELVDHG